MSVCRLGKFEVVLHVSGSVNIGFFVVQSMCNVFLSPLELLTSTQFQVDDCSFKLACRRNKNKKKCSRKAPLLGNDGRSAGRFATKACLGVLTVQKRDRSGWNGPAVPPQPCGGSPSAAT